MEKTKTLYLRQKLGGTFVKQTIDDAYLQLMITMHTVNEVVIEKFLKNCDHTPVFNKMAISHPELCGDLLEAYQEKVQNEAQDYADMKYDEMKEDQITEGRGRFNSVKDNSIIPF